MPLEWMQTFTGRVFIPGSPTPFTICIEDIAHALALENRYNGHTRVPYSVAEHCVRVSRILPLGLQLAGLLHDATEAYIKDIPRAVKSLPEMDGYRALERKIEGAIEARFGISLHDPAVKRADLILLATEARDLMQPFAADWGLKEMPLLEKIEPWSWDKAETEFLMEFGRVYR